MKTFLSFALLLVLGSGSCRAATSLDELVKKVRAAADPREWQVVEDVCSITLTHKNVQFLNPVSLPPLGEKELWEQYSHTNNYRITIEFDTKLTLAEYASLVRLRNDFIAQRTAGLSPQTKDFADASRKAASTIRLPGYYTDHYSVYVYTSDFGVLRLHPDSVQNTRDKIAAIVEEGCSKYGAEAELHAVGDAAQRGRQGTNSTPSAGGSHH